MYIPDGIGEPLCGDCLDFDEPPWYPNNRQRAQSYFEEIFRSHEPVLPVEVTNLIGDCLADPYVP